jgi:hypothetical protein
VIPGRQQLLAVNTLYPVAHVLGIVTLLNEQVASERRG